MTRYVSWVQFRLMARSCYWTYTSGLLTPISGQVINLLIQDLLNSVTYPWHENKGNECKKGIIMELPNSAAT